MDWIRNPKIIGAGLVGLVIAGVLAFGVFGVQTLFIDDKVDEANPFEESDGVSGRAEDATSSSLAEAMNDEMPDDAQDQEAADDMPDMPEITTVGEGTFEGRSHPAEGVAKVITDGEQTFLRFEEFATDNGPDLNVYLTAAPLDGPSDDYDNDFIDLGDLKGNIGDQNYELDADVDIDAYPTVVIWCVRFGVAFGAASLQ
jgi:hypothetical protein